MYQKLEDVVAIAQEIFYEKYHDLVHWTSAAFDE